MTPELRTNLTSGPAPILDFDGTLARLDVDWPGLRRRLDVRSIEDLWINANDRRWAEVTAAEVHAATVAHQVRTLDSLLAGVKYFAVLSNNSEVAVATFLDRFPDMRRRAAAVVGRETLGGPKSSFEVFESGYAHCLHALGRPLRPMYVGDQAYELEFAARLGAMAIDVASLGATNA